MRADLVGQRNRAREVAVALEQECAWLRGLLAEVAAEGTVSQGLLGRVLAVLDTDADFAADAAADADRDEIGRAS